MAEPTIRMLMEDFALRTGLTSATETQRYLWTDAFAVCNFLDLFQSTGDSDFLSLAVRLVDRVHHVLGQHREDDLRSGWISGHGSQEGEQHPTAGGLRIGKPLPERAKDEPLDDRLEWEREGQYFHYLTKWMHALHRVSEVTGDARYHRWAVELAATSHRRFVDQAGGRKRMYWKMSIDLSRPLVTSQGQHDPLDGLITCLRLAADETTRAPDATVLGAAIEDFSALAESSSWVTADPLGIGGLLTDAYRVAQLPDSLDRPPRQLLERILDAAAAGLQHYAHQDPLRFPASERLAFRELGLSIGLRAVERLQEATQRGTRIAGQAELLMRYRSLAETIERYWLEPAHREMPNWEAHREINEVMLATSLAPDGYLGSPPRLHAVR